ncbi:PRA1 family protein F2 [Sesbania bispinosa]|nr:PRA1 family protein F2 [Sesbania bispinosa]
MRNTTHLFSLGNVVDDRLVLLFMEVLTVALLLLTDATLNITVAVLIGVVAVVAQALFRRRGICSSRKKNRLMGSSLILVLLLLDSVTVS